MPRTHEHQTERFIEIVFQAYLNGEGSLTVKEAAEQLNIHTNTIGKITERIFYHDGGWKRIEPTTKLIDVKSRDYGTVLRQREVRSWTVAKNYLRQLAGFASQTLDIMESRQQWDPDTLEEIKDVAFGVGLAGADPEGFFERATSETGRAGKTQCRR